MKKTITVLSLLIVLILSVSLLAACGEPAETPAVDTTEAAAPAAMDIPDGTPCDDYDWLTFNIPDGFEDTHNWETFPELRKPEDGNTTITVQTSFFDEGQDINDAAAKYADYDGYSVGDTFELGGFTWNTVNFTTGSKNSAYYLTPMPDGEHYIYVCARSVTVEDPEVRCVLGSIVLK